MSQPTYERFTDRARKVMALANSEAQRFNHEIIDTPHILLGLVKEGSGVASSVLKNMDVDCRRVRLEVEKLITSGPDLITMGNLPKTPAVNAVLRFAVEEAGFLNHNYIGTEHLLLGLLRDSATGAASVLLSLGLKLETVREAVLNLLGAEKPDRAEASVVAMVVTSNQVLRQSITALVGMEHRPDAAYHIALMADVLIPGWRKKPAVPEAAP